MIQCLSDQLVRDAWIGFGKIQLNDREVVVMSLGFLNELANHCCMLQAARVSWHSSFLDTGTDELIGEQVCC